MWYKLIDQEYKTGKKELKKKISERIFLFTEKDKNSFLRKLSRSFLSHRHRTFAVSRSCSSRENGE